MKRDCHKKHGCVAEFILTTKITFLYGLEHVSAWAYCLICGLLKVDDTPMVIHPEKIDFRRFV